jgi:PilZ domain
MPTFLGSRRRTSTPAAALQVMTMASWSRKFDEPIPLPRGRHLVALRDVGNYITPRVRMAASEIDGTWRRDCKMIDASQTGARLLIEGSLQGLDLGEFFLLLSSTGLAYRRCKLVRVDGDQIGVEFLARGKAAAKKPSADQAV